MAGWKKWKISILQIRMTIGLILLMSSWLIYSTYNALIPIILFSILLLGTSHRTVHHSKHWIKCIKLIIQLNKWESIVGRMNVHILC